MRLKKNLTQLVESDYTPLQTNQEGLLRGGFGAMTAVASPSKIHIIIGKNGECQNEVCSNPKCSNECTVNYCQPPSSSPSPSSTTACAFFDF